MGNFRISNQAQKQQAKEKTEEGQTNTENVSKKSPEAD